MRLLHEAAKKVTAVLVHQLVTKDLHETMFVLKRLKNSTVKTAREWAPRAHHDTQAHSTKKRGAFEVEWDIEANIWHLRKVAGEEQTLAKTQE